MAQVTLFSDENKRWQAITRIWRDNRWLMLVSGWFLGMITFPAIDWLSTSSTSFFRDLVPEFVGILFTVMIVDQLAENRSSDQLKDRLVREASGQSNETAKSAVDWIRDEGWLTGRAGLLRRENLRNANLNGANLNDANLQETDLWMADISDALIINADLQNADLKLVCFRRTQAQKANLAGADLWRADLEGAKLIAADLQGADLRYANLSGVDLSDANLEGVNLLMTIFDTNITLPDGKKWDPETNMARFTDPNAPDFWRSRNPGSPAFRR